ncbi:25S rRNA (uridine-N(3))-methyltransferase [Grifola frondosa]|uniref:25S rRNA (Uridine-N(3))-methyltransferase n=1 Tax=Grifola frondosa TaxID=5627 RepID=A0A1C7MQQ8_GRIFR|nr:25S rRNA (uridine-N(3))-methyltransferase [Grifola frondosa]
MRKQRLRNPFFGAFKQITSEHNDGQRQRRKKTSLKAALSSQQSRLKKKQEATQAAQLAEKSKKGAQSKGKGKATPPQTTIPFHPTDNILLIGEGNFSFARALVLRPPASLQYLPAENVTATAYDSEEECFSKYPDAREIVRELREKGAEIVFSVDATKLEKCAILKGKKWDKIVWNFPHAGKGITDQDRNILSNQLLLLGFLRSASNFLAAGPIPSIMRPRKRKQDPDGDEDDVDASDAEAEPDSLHTSNVKARGTILVTLRNVPPYTLWNLPKLAKSPPPPSSTGVQPNPHYIQLRSFAFQRQEWSGYEHRMTKGERANGQGKTGEGGEDRTWEFCLKD